MLAKISIWSVLIPFIAGIVAFRSIDKSAKIIWCITALACVPQLSRYFIPNPLLRVLSYNLYSVFEFVLTQYFFSIFLAKRNEAIFIKLSIVLFGLFYFALTVNFGISRRFLYEIVCFDNLVYTIEVLYILYREFDTDSKMFKMGNSEFYYLIGILLYAPVTVFIYSLWQYFQNASSTSVTHILIIHYLFNTIMYVLFGIGIIRSYRSNKLMS